MTSSIFILLLAFQLKHFGVDYLLQRGIGKFSPDKRVWIPALLVHSLHHVMGTYAVLGGFAVFGLGRLDQHIVNVLLGLSLFNGLVHFIMDRLKASPFMWSQPGRFYDLGGDGYFRTRPQFWWALGFDQMVHHVTDLVCVLVMANLA